MWISKWWNGTPCLPTGARAPGTSAKGIDAINVSAAVNDPYFGLIRFSTAKAFPPVATNWGYFSTPETEKLAAAVKHAFTPAEMNQAAGELHAALVDQVPFLFVAHDVGPRAISPAVTGWCNRRAGLSTSAR